MDRQEHMAWCKRRAIDQLKNGTAAAFASMASDLSKHPETENHKAMEMVALLLIGGHLNSDEQMRRFIEGFN